MSVFQRWLLDLEPFAHILRAGSGRFSPAPLWWLLAIDVAVIVRG
jgi:polyether ionophore transport system permease protein